MSFHRGLVHLLFWHVLAFNHLSRHANPTTTDKTYIKRKWLLVLNGTHCIGKWNERLGFRPLVNLNWTRQTLRQWNECVKHARLRLELHWTPDLVAGSPKHYQGEWPLYWEVRHITNHITKPPRQHTNRTFTTYWCIAIHQHIEDKMKWTTFHKWHFQMYFLQWKCLNFDHDSLKFVPKGPNKNIPALVQIMVWRWAGDKPLSEPVMVSLLMHICVIRPQWVSRILINLLTNLFFSPCAFFCSFQSSFLASSSSIILRKS